MASPGNVGSHQATLTKSRPREIIYWPFVAFPSAWKNLFQAGPGSHILGVARMPTSVSIWQTASKTGWKATSELWRVMSTPFKSTFSTVRLREGVTRGAGSRTAGLVMAFKLLQVAEGHWRRLDGAELIPLVSFQS